MANRGNSVAQFSRATAYLLAKIFESEIDYLGKSAKMKETLARTKKFDIDVIFIKLDTKRRKKITASDI